MPLRVSLVNLQKFTFHSCDDWLSMRMFAPAQNTRSLAEVSTTAPTSGCSKRSRWTASYSSMSTPRSYELSLSSYPGLRPPSSFTSIDRVATGPLNASFQCRYFAGSVRKSTRIRSVVSAIALAQDDPERLGLLAAEILPAVRD